MVVAVLANDIIKHEIISKKVPQTVNIIWADSLRALKIIEADAYFDLLFENDQERISQLKSLLPGPVFINSVVFTSNDFIRINAWPTMIGRDVVEIASPEKMLTVVQSVFEALDWKYQIVPDTPGMITPRIIAMIINEAWYALGEEISTKQEIDTAMKLGTNYPYGPFEWGERIGFDNIRKLLKELQLTDPRYTIAPMLNKL